MGAWSPPFVLTPLLLLLRSIAPFSAGCGATLRPQPAPERYWRAAATVPPDLDLEVEFEQRFADGRRVGVESSSATSEVEGKPTRAVSARKSTQKPQKDSAAQNQVRWYLDSLANVQLLKAEEEISLARSVQRLLELRRDQEKLATKLGRAPTTQEAAEHVSLDPATLRQQLRAGLLGPCCPAPAGCYPGRFRLRHPPLRAQYRL